METSFYKPNKAGTGTAFAFKLVPDDKAKSEYKRGILGFLFTAIKQAKPLNRSGGETDVFTDNTNVAEANTVGKLSEIEVAGMIRIVETTRFRPNLENDESPYPACNRLRMYHQFQGGSKTIEFYPFNLKGREPGKQEWTQRLAFSFTVTEGRGEKSNKFSIALEVDEAWLLKFFLTDGLSAIHSQKLRREMEYRRRREGESNAKQGTSPSHNPPRTRGGNSGGARNWSGGAGRTPPPSQEASPNSSTSRPGGGISIPEPVR
jgi:hypothetical protein